MKTEINEKAVYFSKSPYSDTIINTTVEITIKIKSNVLLFIFI